MRIANVAGRATLVTHGGGNAELIGLDVEKASDGRFPADPQALFEHWDAFRDWAVGHADRGDIGVQLAELGAPTPA